MNGKTQFLRTLLLLPLFVSLTTLSFAAVAPEPQIPSRSVREAQTGDRERQTDKREQASDKSKEYQAKAKEHVEKLKKASADFERSPTQANKEKLTRELAQHKGRGRFQHDDDERQFKETRDKAERLLRK